MWIFIIVIDILLKFEVKTRNVKIIRHKKIENKREGERYIGKIKKKKKTQAVKHHYHINVWQKIIQDKKIIILLYKATISYDLTINMNNISFMMI